MGSYAKRITIMKTSNKERPIYKWTLVVCSLIMIAYFATDARASEEDDVAEISAICFSTASLLSFSPGIFTADDMMSAAQESKWWREFLVAWLGDDAAAIRLQLSNKYVQDAFDKGTLDVADVGIVMEQCAALKRDILFEEE